MVLLKVQRVYTETLIEKVIEDAKKGAISSGEGVEGLSRRCIYGIFNAYRAANCSARRLRADRG